MHLAHVKGTLSVNWECAAIDPCKASPPFAESDDPYAMRSFVARVPKTRSVGGAEWSSGYALEILHIPHGVPHTKCTQSDIHAVDKL